MCIRDRHIVAEHGEAALVLCVGHGALEQLGEAVAVENVIALDHGAAVVANELLAQNKGLCQTVRGGLHLILQMDAEMCIRDSRYTAVHLASWSKCCWAAAGSP